MAVHESYLHAHASPIRRTARVASVVLLALTLLLLLGSDAPATWSLHTAPFAATCFLAMLFGLAIAWEHDLQGGVTTVIAWALLFAVSREARVIPFVVFPAVALLNILAAWHDRRGHAHA